LIVCPTCGRTEIDVIDLARRVERALHAIDKPLRIAVMGCVVNGPGEAADADFAICAGRDKAYFYRGGEKIATVPESEIIPRLLEALAAL
jgi:(E)-4-hydroxy-3-methylbut-2-enyl-diphosphate synthase